MSIGVRYHRLLVLQVNGRYRVQQERTLAYIRASVWSPGQMECSRQQGRDMSNGGIACIPPGPDPRHTPASYPVRLARQVYPPRVGRFAPTSVLCRDINLHLFLYAVGGDMGGVWASFGESSASLDL